MIALGMAGDKIRVHYTGLDQQKFCAVNRMIAKQKLGVSGPLFITAGALIPRKNQALVIEAVLQFPDATLLLAGAGPEEANYRALCEKLRLSSRVRFLGSVPHDGLPQLLAASDIAILASQSEGLANAWVEALACGTPIIISEAGGARELISSDVSGRIVEQSSEAIARAISSILKNPPSQEAVRASVGHFSWKNNGDQLLAFFQDIA